MNLCSDPSIPHVEIKSITVIIDFSLVDDIFLNALSMNVVEGLECDVIHSVHMLEERTILFP